MANETVTGMNLQKLEAFRKALEEKPVILGLEARSVWEGHSGRNTVHIGPYSLDGKRIDRDTRHYTMAYGAWKEVEEALGFEGPTDRMEPVEMALGAVAACVTNAIGLNAPRNGIKLDDLDVRVNNKIIGTGNAVKVGENYGIRMSYVGDLSDRISALGAGAAEGPAQDPVEDPDGELEP